jgi:hypothetical protein
MFGFLQLIADGRPKKNIQEEGKTGIEENISGHPQNKTIRQ